MAALVDTTSAEEVVRALPLLAHLPKDKLGSFLSSFSLVTFEPGSFLCRKGTPSPGLLVLVQGTARASSDATSGNLPSAQNTDLPLLKTGNKDSTSSVSSSQLGGLLDGGLSFQPRSFQVDNRLTSSHPAAQLNPPAQSQSQSQSQPQPQPQSQSQIEASVQCSLDDDLGSAAAVAEGTPDPRQGFTNSRPPSDTPYSDKAIDPVSEAASRTVTDAMDTVTVTGAVADSISGNTTGVSYTLRPGDWFGHPTSASEAPILFVDVVASSQVTCAFFPGPPAPAHPGNPATSLSKRTPKGSKAVLQPNAIQEQTLPLRHPLYFVPSPEDLNRVLAGKLEEILHLQTLPSPDSQIPQNSAQNPGPGSSTSVSDQGASGSADSFQGYTPREMFGYPRIFGGQLIGQALMAATRTVSPSLLAHSLHCYFLRPGDTGAPVVYRVERLRDGASFSARRVKAYQGTREIFLFTASFHKPEPGLAFAVPPRPNIPSPEDLLMVEEEEWRLRTTPCLPMVMRRRLARHQVRPMPVELRHCESVERLAVAQLLREFPHPKATSRPAATPMIPHPKSASRPAATPQSQRETPQSQREAAQSQKETPHPPRSEEQDQGPKFEPQLNAWIRARGLSAASNDLRLHRCIIGYFSDFVLLGTTLAAHGLFPANPRKFNMASLDHAMWFHEECRADEWLLYSLSSPWSGHARGMSLGRMFTRDGRLVVSTAQEGLIRPLNAGPSTPSKL